MFAQLTVRTGTQFTGVISAQGRSVQHGGPHPDDWDQAGITFSNSGGGAAPPPPPAGGRGGGSKPGGAGGCADISSTCEEGIFVTGTVRDTSPPWRLAQAGNPEH